MYSNDQIRSLQEETRRLLVQADQPPKQGLEIKALREVLQFHENRYYVQNDPLIADAEYDRLFQMLVKIEAAHPEWITPDSPSQRVAPGLSSDFPSVQHLVPMLSLDNSYDPQDLIDWDRRVREGSGIERVEYCVEPKFDGASISLVYTHDLLSRGATRGDGVAGDEITRNLRQIRSLPLSAAFAQIGIDEVEIRGEVLLSKRQFHAFNQQLLEQNLPPLANPRNAAAGTLRIKDPSEVARRGLEAFVYHISFAHQAPGKEMPEALRTHSGSIDLLWNLGFRSPMKERKICLGINDVIAYCTEFEAKRDDLPYEIDGMVVKVNNIAVQEQLGMTTHHPRWAVAFKFKARQGTSRLVSVEYQVGRTGSITPVAKIEPVSIGGVTVSSISLHNEDFIREKDILLGDTLLVERAGDVIPYVVKSLAELRDGSETPIIFPARCPECQTPLNKAEGEAVWRCPNFQCRAQLLERMIHFTSKDAMDIRGLGEANIRKFHERGWLDGLPSIYRLPYDQIRQMEGFGDKSVDKLQEAINKSKEQPLHRLIYALGIRYVGETTAKSLAQQVDHLGTLAYWDRDRLLAVEDIGVKVAESIYEFFHNADNLLIIQEFETLGLNLSSAKRQQAGGNLEGKTFLFTGTLRRMKRSEAEELAESMGGRLLSGVSSNLNFLVAGEEAGSKLEKARKIPSIQIISEAEFLELTGYGKP